MELERRRASRHVFTARAEIMDEKENVRATSKVSDLSLNGCYVEITNPFPEGTNVMIEMYTETEFLESQATVAYLEPGVGMGLTFNGMQPYFTRVLNKWLSTAPERRAARTA